MYRGLWGRVQNKFVIQWCVKIAVQVFRHSSMAWPAWKKLLHVFGKYLTEVYPEFACTVP